MNLSSRAGSATFYIFMLKKTEKKKKKRKRRRNKLKEIIVLMNSVFKNRSEWSFCLIGCFSFSSSTFSFVYMFGMSWWKSERQMTAHCSCFFRVSDK
jgi:hypothetical protein